MDQSPKRRWPQRFIWVTAAILIIFFGFRAYYRWTDDFRLANITHDIPYNPQWEISLPPEQHEQLAIILQQPFTYVGKGAQAYAFASKDKKYVIKFFKFKHLKPNAYISMFEGLPIAKEYNSHQTARKKKLINSVFSGHKLAYDSHKDESGLIFIHLNKTTHLKLNAQLIDKLGFKRSIDLDSVIFVIQKYAATTRQAIKDALDSHDLALAKLRMNSVIDLYLAEYKKGIYDRDHGVMHNTGFDGDRAIHLDVGKLTADENMKDLVYYRPDLIKVANKFEIWLRKNYPHEYTELRSFLEGRLSEIFGEPFKFHS